MNPPQNSFMQHHKLVISTLTPVHIGCGEDYEPTNYIVNEGLLYGFDTGKLAALLSPEQYKSLLAIVNGNNALLGVQKFVDELGEEIPAIATHTVRVCKSFADKHRNRIGKPAPASQENENKIINALAIPRTAFDAYTMQPVLLGSSLKGAIRTALLNRRNNGHLQKKDKREHKKFEEELLGGKFNTDPLRMIKVGDAQFSQNESSIDNRILWDCNLKKTPRNDGKESKAISIIREVIAEMNSQSFYGEICLNQLGSIKKRTEAPSQPFEFAELVDACNDFYRQLLQGELEILEQLNCLDRDWLSTFKKIQPHLDRLFKARKAMLIRVGRHSGAEGVTIDGVRSIKITQRKGPSRFENKATTLWLAGEAEKSSQNLIPFGWVLAEIDPDVADSDSQYVATALRDYNSQAIVLQKQHRNMLKEKQQAVELNKQKVREQQTERERQQAEEILRLQQEKQRLAALSDEMREIEELLQRMGRGEDKGQRAGCQLATAVAKTMDSAVAWPNTEKLRLLEVIPALLKHLDISTKSNKWKKRIKSLQA